eukprot:scaffold196036_cov24-Tisochrysis_lutea.AAC.3
MPCSCMHAQLDALKASHCWHTFLTCSLKTISSRLRTLGSLNHTPGQEHSLIAPATHTLDRTVPKYPDATGIYANLLASWNGPHVDFEVPGTGHPQALDQQGHSQ